MKMTLNINLIGRTVQSVSDNGQLTGFLGSIEKAVFD